MSYQAQEVAPHPQAQSSLRALQEILADQERHARKRYHYMQARIYYGRLSTKEIKQLLAGDESSALYAALLCSYIDALIERQ